MRNTIIDIAKSIGMQIKETHIKCNNINQMDESFISSTGIGLLECFWKGWKSDYFWTKRIKKELFNRIKNS